MPLAPNPHEACKGIRRAQTTAVLMPLPRKAIRQSCFWTRHFSVCMYVSWALYQSSLSVVLLLWCLLPAVCGGRKHRYLRGRIKTLPDKSSSSSSSPHLSYQRAREAHFKLYRRTRENALALWLETVGTQGHPKSACGTDISVGELLETVTICVSSLSCTAEGFPLHGM